MRYRPATEMDDKDADQLQAIFDAVDELYREPPGDILIFLNGEREIRDTADALEKLKLPHTEVLPLYARLSAAEQNRIFQSHAGRRIVLSTNVAETSLTVPGIRYVIDPAQQGSPATAIARKFSNCPLKPLARPARINGKAAVVASLPVFVSACTAKMISITGTNLPDPEILRTNLASVIHGRVGVRPRRYSTFPVSAKTGQSFINDGVRLLDELGALKAERKQGLQLTPLGKQLSRLPIDPRLARMVLAGAERNCLDELLVITAALSIQDPRERPLDKKQKLMNYMVVLLTLIQILPAG